MSASVVTGRAAARVGLLGNPSDGYGGRVLAMSLPAFQAEVSLTGSQEWDTTQSPLLDATVTALSERRPSLVAEPAALRFTTSIPRQVGLSGSSAIIIAALRALGARAKHTWDLVELAKTALEVETDVLGWAAGPQDRVVIAYEGLLDMDFQTPWQAGSYRHLERSRLPSLFVAWSPDPGRPSGEVHSDVQQRWLDAEPLVVETMKEFADLAVAGRTALNNDTAAKDWPPLMARSFELRRRLWTISDRSEQLVSIGTDAGAGVTFAGSGGAVVGAVSNSTMLHDLRAAYRDQGLPFMVISP